MVSKGLLDPDIARPTPEKEGRQVAEMPQRQAGKGSHRVSLEAEDSVVVFVDRVLNKAIEAKASDIHFEPYERNYRIRFRTDGVLYEVAQPQTRLGQMLTSRLKVMAGLDIAERRLPQDGRIRLALGQHKATDFRISTLPTLWGEKAVLRLFGAIDHSLQPEDLGLETEQLQAYLNALNQPQGMILITGPTGSGKTITLYAGLNRLNRSDVNIATAEDPVEVNLPGINQLQVNNRTGLTFSVALRAFLRQDPDILMVGEIRDLETAEIAVKAAQTGHRVLSTLHTNSATETLNRLNHLGISSFNIASSCSLIVAQRLVRKLCERCKVLQNLPRQVLCAEGFQPDEIDQLQIFQAVGCADCMGGYQARTGIYETLAISPKIAQMIMAESNSLELSKQATEEGFANLRTAALNKVRAGITSLTEANRVTRS